MTRERSITLGRLWTTMPGMTPTGRTPAPRSRGRSAAEDLERLAEAAWWTAHPKECIDALERAYAATLDEANASAGGVRGAAARRTVERAAAVRRRRPAGSSGRRGCSTGSTRERRARVPRARDGEGQRQRRGDDGARDDGARHRHALRRPRSAGVRVDVQGMAHIAQAQVDNGMSLIDEATVAAVGGELTPLATGIVYCFTIVACMRPRGLPACRRVDRGHDTMVRAAGDQRVPGPLPGAPRRDHAPAGSVRRRRGAGPTTRCRS